MMHPAHGHGERHAATYAASHPSHVLPPNPISEPCVIPYPINQNMMIDTPTYNIHMYMHTYTRANTEIQHTRIRVHAHR